MKKKIFIGIFIVAFILLLNFIYFVATVGMYSDDPPSLGEKISSAFAHPLWLSPFYTIIISVSNPILTLFLIVLIITLYYLYDHFVIDKKDIQIDTPIESAGVIENQNQNQIYGENSKIEFYNNKSSRTSSGSRLFKYIVLWSVPLVAIWVIYVFSSFSGPGMGLPVLVFLMPVMPIIYIFYPAYFIILSIRYSREKGSMDPLDKIMFYILLIPIAFLGIFTAYKIYSGNLIREAFINRQREASIAATIAQEDAKIAGLADLVIKDININSDELDIKYCNESDKVNGKKVTMKIETDKGYSDILPNYLMPQPGKCEESRMFIVKYFNIKIGDAVGITVTLDPENKVSETNKENNKMTKSIIFGKVVERQQDLEKPMAQTDLVVKDIYYNYSSQLDVKFCNNSENSSTGDFSIKVDADRKSDFTFQSVGVPEPSKCSDRVLAIEKLGINKGDVANISVIIDPENKINETNKENNKMIKSIIFGKMQGGCFDTDGGSNYYTQGQTTILIKNEGSLDCCRESLAAGPCLPQSQHLIEGYCDNGKPLTELYKCPNGCVDGACIE